MTPDQLDAALRFLLITDDALLDGRDVVDVCAAAIRGGVTAVQLRLKLADDRTLFEAARRLVSHLSVPVFVNDRVDVALAAEAAGVHLGPDDLAPALARRLVPAGFAIGASVGSDAEAARGYSADYWGIGPLHGSRTKPDAGVALGWSGAQRYLDAAEDRPCVVVGGVMPADVTTAVAMTFAGVAVISGVLGHVDVEAAAREYGSLVAEATARRTTP